eukprot:Phypoly_transcript_24549.p1 GENE.Phypoly_transcript_24549~~Phypoly_transcript_24549.p1  ORF type:complete len:145 (+),score=7.74 Phypoly_transcript_24549:65-499(+)
MVRIMVAVDSDKSSEKAFQEALNSFHPDTDKLYLCSITSNWDYLNVEKNAARLDLYKCENWCQTTNIKYKVIQLEASDVATAFLELIDRKKINHFYIGATAFINCADPENYVFNTFSFFKRIIWGSVPDIIFKKAPCKVHRVSS